MFIFRVEESLDSFDQSQKNAYISRFMIAMKVRFVPKSPRLKALQLSLRMFCQDILLRTSNRREKMMDSSSSFSSKIHYLNIYHHLHSNMLNPTLFSSFLALIQPSMLVLEFKQDLGAWFGQTCLKDARKYKKTQSVKARGVRLASFFSSFFLILLGLLILERILQNFGVCVCVCVVWNQERKRAFFVFYFICLQTLLANVYKGHTLDHAQSML